MTERTPKTDQRPLIAHIVVNFDYGGLENGVVNVVNGLPEDAFRHAIIALTQISGIRSRVRAPDVSFHALEKQPGKDPAAYLRLYRLLKRLRPAIVHTRNLGTLDGAVVARFAGVPHTIHGEHGWDVYDPEGKSRKYRTLRRLVNPMVGRFVTVSRELERWLTADVGIRAEKVTRICNGVDTRKFRPADGMPRQLLPSDRFPADCVVIGSVTRFAPIKDPMNLVRAFAIAKRSPAGASLRLAMIGDGPLKAEADQFLSANGLANQAWLPGSRDDVAPLLREMNLFALGSLREGISNTVLESMASGLPVIASRTGGNLELVQDGVTGRLVQPGSAEDIAEALLHYATHAELRSAHGAAARERVERDYSLNRMLADYEALYRAQLIRFARAA